MMDLLPKKNQQKTTASQDIEIEFQIHQIDNQRENDSSYLIGFPNFWWVFFGGGGVYHTYRERRFGNIYMLTLGGILGIKLFCSF